MSVPVGKRRKSQLAIETAADGLLQYILNITVKYYLPLEHNDESKDTYDKFVEYSNARWFAERMRAEMLTCIANIQTANKIKIEGEESFHDRRVYQIQAERSIENVLMAASLMYKRKLIKSKRVKYIGQQVACLKRMIQNWRKSDKSRYSNSGK